MLEIFNKKLYRIFERNKNVHFLFYKIIGIDFILFLVLKNYRLENVLVTGYICTYLPNLLENKTRKNLKTNKK